MICGMMVLGEMRPATMRLHETFVH